MKAYWLLPIVIAAGAVCFTAGRHCGAGAPDDLAALADTARLEKSLRLSPQQAEQVRALAKEFQGRAQSACDQHCEARCTMARKLFQENLAEAGMQKYVEDMSAAYAAQERATVEHLVRLRALLTPEQAKELNRQFAVCICEKCAGTTGSCCTAGSGRR
jgi:hypothetical protein